MDKLENKEVLEYKIKGIDKKKEIIIALPLGILVLLIATGLLYLYAKITGTNAKHINYIHITAVISLSASLTFFIFTLLAKSFLKDDWLIQLNKTIQTLFFQYGKKKYTIKLKEITKISFLGQPNFRYLTFFTNHQKISLRVGNSFMTPFSKQEDIEKLDELFLALEPFIKENFNQKILKNKIGFNPFYGFGVYVEKSQKIKYSVINRLDPIILAPGIVLIGSIFFFLLISVTSLIFEDESSVGVDLSIKPLKYLIILFLIYSIIVYFYLKKRPKNN